MQYKDFLETKIKNHIATGFSVSLESLNNKLFDFQKYCVQLALKQGKYALFEECGLGKTFQQIEWAYQVMKYTNKSVIILTPLAVSGQTIKEGEKLGYKITKIKPMKSEKIPASIESLPKSGPTVLSSTIFIGVGRAPDLSSKARSVAS